MKRVKIKLVCLILFPISLLLDYLYSLYPYVGEAFYSLRINKLFIQALSTLTGLLPFSLFEIIFYLIIPTCIFYILYSVWKVFSCKKSWKTFFLNFALNLSACVSIIYFLFMSFWGFNYNRPRFGENVGIHISKHTHDDLADLYSYLISELNVLGEQTLRNEEGYMILNSNYKSTLKRARLGYDEASKIFPCLGGRYGDPKPVLTSEYMNYTGIAGIYFPLTGEPNINVALLDSSIPSTALHEMAHQRGYANEDECHFIAFLTSSMHPDVDYKYSGYLLALSYTASALAKDNPNTLRTLNQELSPNVLNDIYHANNFLKKYDGEIKVISTKVNDTYLKANGVSDGEKSYGRMVDLLLSYYNLYIKE